MPTAVIHYPGARISLLSRRLHVAWKDDESSEQHRELPLRDLERLILTSSTSITMPALAALLKRDIPVSLLDGRGRYLGSFQPATPEHGASRLRQYDRHREPDFCLNLAGRIIIAKIYNQRRLVQRVAANRKAEDRPVPAGIPAALNAMENAMNAAGHAENLATLRGHEGLASARYFSAWASLLPENFPFERRSTRPPLNPVNTVLSFASTLIYNEIHAYLNAHGLDPAPGILHATENGRWSLALDLMEPFRPVIAEAITLDLFSHKMLNQSHFEPHEGGIYLTKDGRSKLLLQYEKRMERQFMSESVGHRTTLRQQLEDTTTQFKAALDKPEKFQPFLIN